MLRNIVTRLEAIGITPNHDDTYCYKKLTKDPECCHFELYGFTHFPVKIKTAYSDSANSNQAERYITQISRMRDEVLFVYHGHGWKKNSYKRALNDIKRIIGNDHVLNLHDFEKWLKASLEEKESR